MAPPQENNSMPREHFKLPHGHPTPGDTAGAAQTPLSFNTPVATLAPPTPYCFAPTRNHTGTMGNPVIDARMELIVAANNAGEVVNPNSAVGGHGSWRFLTEHDEYYAKYLGFPTPEDVNRARRNGQVQPVKLTREMPCIIFTPRKDLLNPASQPAGSGSWQFLVDDSREIATLSLGGQDGYGFGGIDSPSAEDVWRLRQQYEGRFDEDGIRIDPTADIDIVWQFDNPADAIIQQVAEIEESDAWMYTDIGYGIDPNALLAHDPMNGGEVDQRARNQKSANYQTRLFTTVTGQKKKITLDRAAVDKTKNKPVNGEPNKLWFWDEYRWVRYDRASTIDWNDKKQIDHLDRWRDQGCSRANWPNKKLAKKQVNYTEEQKKYLFELIDKEGGAKPYTNLEAFTKDFNTKFRLEGETARNKTAIGSVVSKMINDWKKTGGKMPAKKQRRAPMSKIKGKEKVLVEEDVVPEDSIEENAVEDDTVQSGEQNAPGEAFEEEAEVDAPWESDSDMGP